MQRAAELVLAAGLEAEVELLGGDTVQVLDDPDRVGPRQPTDATGDARGPVHDPQVGVHPLGDVGSLHLDDRPAAVVEHAGVDLSGRRRREGHLVELGERLIEGEAEVSFHHLAHGREGRRLEPVETPAARLRERRREQAG